MVELLLESPVMEATLFSGTAQYVYYATLVHMHHTTLRYIA
jgi:hypothetical protein